MNESTGNWTNYLEFHGLMAHWEKCSHTMIGFDVIFIVLDFIANGWFLYCFLRNANLRKTLMNQLICSISVMNLLHIFAMLISIAEMSHHLNWITSYHCELYMIHHILLMIFMFVPAWTLATIVGVYLAQNLGVEDFTSRLHPTVALMGRVGLILGPWVTSVILAPPILKHFHKSAFYRELGDSCFFLSLDSARVLATLGLTVSQGLALLCLPLAEVARKRRIRQSPGFSASHSEGLVDQEPEVSRSLAYAAALFVSVAANMCLNVQVWIIVDGYDGITMWLVVKVMMDSSVVLILLPWLLIKDIRDVVLVLPWKRASDADHTNTFTVGYRKTP